MTSDLLALLLGQNTRTVHLRLDGEDVHVVPAGTPGAAIFTLRRVPARDIRSNLLYMVLGKDGYVAYATWYNAQGQAALASAQATARDPNDPIPFDDSPEDDASWRAHTLALETAVEEELLTQGLVLPDGLTAAQVIPALGLYRPVLVRELVQWGRETPEDPNSPSASSAPP